MLRCRPRTTWTVAMVSRIRDHSSASSESKAVEASSKSSKSKSCKRSSTVGTRARRHTAPVNGKMNHKPQDSNTSCHYLGLISHVGFAIGLPNVDPMCSIINICVVSIIRTSSLAHMRCIIPLLNHTYGFVHSHDGNFGVQHGELYKAQDG